MTKERQIDYDALLHEAFREAQRSVMRSVLTDVAERGLPGEHHFYISFNTLAPGVSIAPRLLQKYPNEMTIVLQHRFWDLFVQADRFEVKLTFDSIRERLVVPFSSVRVFFDPSVPYGLQFDEPHDGRQGPLGEVMGFSGGRSGARTQRGPSERSPSERKRVARKPKGDSAAEVVGAGPAEPAPVSPSSRQSEQAGPPAALPAPAAASSAKSGPRLVESANDSAKVVSLDQFRKK